MRWESRQHRKHHNRLDRRTGSTWWAPSAVGWWIGVLFMIGAVGFFGALLLLPERTDELEASTRPTIATT